MKIETAMALARMWGGLVSRINVFTGPVEKKMQSMDNESSAIDSRVSWTRNAAAAAGTAIKIERPQTRL